MLIDDRDRVGNHLPAAPNCLHCRSLCSVQLLLVIAQLIQQAFAQIAASDSRRIHLPDHFERLVQIRTSLKLGWNAAAGRSACLAGASGFGSVRKLSCPAAAGAIHGRHRSCHHASPLEVSGLARQSPSAIICLVHRRQSAPQPIRESAAEPRAAASFTTFSTMTGVGFGRRWRRHSHQFFVAGNQVSVFVQVADDQFGRLAAPPGVTESAPTATSGDR